MHARSGSGLDAQTDARTLGYCNCHLASRNLSGGMETSHLHATVKERMEKLFAVANGEYTKHYCGRALLLARDGKPD